MKEIHRDTICKYLSIHGERRKDLIALYLFSIWFRPANTPALEYLCYSVKLSYLIACYGRKTSPVQIFKTTTAWIVQPEIIYLPGPALGY